MDGSILTPAYLELLGKQLDDIDDYQRQDGTLIEPGKLWLRTRRDTFIEHFLKIRTKWSNRGFFQLNRPQRELSYWWRSQNIVLKARQLGITTYVAARFFTQTITQPGILSMQVTQDRESSEDIFRIVQPGRMQMAEDRLGALEKNDLRRTVYDRIVIAGITFALTFAVSAVVAWREFLGRK
jgi:hypothetical protein